MTRRLRIARALLPLACVAPWLAAHAQSKPDPAAFEFYFNLYPEWKEQHFGTPSAAGTDVGNMGTLRNDTTVLAKNANPKATTRDQAWSNSYIGFRGQLLRHGDLTLGYDVQGLIDFVGRFQENFRTRDAFVWVDHPGFGRLSYGQMDTMYKEAGDPLRLLNVSSGNIVSTARTQSGVGWKAAGDTTFNNRVNHMLLWVSPKWSGFNLGASYSTRPVVANDHVKTSLAAASVQWRNGPWYAALATEVHNNWLPVSKAADLPLPAATSIRNMPATVTSRDQGWRITGAWSEGQWRFAADVARLRYTEDDSAALAGKFRSYANYTGQVSGEYKLDARWRFAANHARGTAGTCTLSGGVSCSTNGLGGNQTSVGAMARLNDIASLFVLAVHTRNNPAAYYGSSAQGANTNAYAVGIKLASK
ncbi:porin [Caenimonas koreensis DSM 17982]|uniref:Porin n=1 Tax=Caenimonas koreensis DSM 17982 TaxID=1121255 RepID=A0A844B7G1_9BURK|nr:porin [Caenimonas koreensis]MRD47346.1 porin [Caenimonas koreensis DSM 17982]